MRSPSPGPYGGSPQGASPQPSGTSTPLLSRAPTPPLYLPSRLLDTRRQHRLDLERLNFRWRTVYLTDLYHTLVNCPWYRFYALFLVFYLSMYAAFAAFYASQPGCISRVHNFWHALWFSVTSSATIGYGHQAPDPNCYLLNVGVMAQVLVSLLMQASLLGVVFARISNSRGRSATIRFSKALSMYRKEDGLYRLAFRIANLRRSQVLSPKVRFLLLRRQAVHPFCSGDTEYVYTAAHRTHWRRPPLAGRALGDRTQDRPAVAALRHERGRRCKCRHGVHCAAGWSGREHLPSHGGAALLPALRHPLAAPL